MLFRSHWKPLGHTASGTSALYLTCRKYVLVSLDRVSVFSDRF